MMQEGNPQVAASMFQQAWDNATTHDEHFIAAHYVARHQPTVDSKLEWDKIALEHALQIDRPDVTSVLPSLYLNIAKCYEDMGQLNLAEEHYNGAAAFVSFLGEDGYSRMIATGVEKGLERVKALKRV